MTAKKPQEKVFSLVKWWATTHGLIPLPPPLPPSFFLSSHVCLRDSACYTLVYVCVCVCIGRVCQCITGLKLHGMKFIEVTGALWWKLCEGISTMTIARAHAKWFVFSLFLMKVLLQLFRFTGSRYGFNLLSLYCQLNWPVPSIGRGCENKHYRKVV